MSSNILVVEDEIFVATEIEHVIGDMGHTPVGIAADEKSALALANAAEIALVDLNLRDGATGIQIGKQLAQAHGVTVLFMTANPNLLGDGVAGTLGVLCKPVSDKELRSAINFAVARRENAEAEPPRRMKLFN
jgi:DNA-binding response OmpR family regulator